MDTKSKQDLCKRKEMQVWKRANMNKHMGPEGPESKAPVLPNNAIVNCFQPVPSLRYKHLQTEAAVLQSAEFV